MDAYDISKITSLSDEILLAWFKEVNESFKNHVNAGNDELADKMDSLSVIIENELLSREHIDLKQIYK
jgi:hypothetical protein